MAGQQTNGKGNYDAVVVGASLAGCATATLLARGGARVALVERRPDPAAFKRVCGHYIQSSAVPALERLGLLEAIEAAGGVRSRARVWTRWGTTDPSAESRWPAGVNLRRERLDPIAREMAAKAPGVDLVLGRAVAELRFDAGRVSGVVATDRGGDRIVLDARLVVAADGRDSRLAGLADVPTATSPHGRFSYAGYFEGPPPGGAPDATVWFTDPHWAAAFPTDDGLTLYACMPTKDRLPEFRRDLDGALVSFVAGLPEAPPIRESRQVGPVIGKIEMPNLKRRPAHAGMALVGDAALATDPLWGVGCGWAFQSAQWLAEAVGPALGGAAPIEAGLRRYARRHRRALDPHAFMIHDYATGRRFNRMERMLFAGSAADPKLAARMEGFATRNTSPAGLLSPATVAGVAVAGLRGRRRRSAARRPEAAADQALVGLAVGVDADAGR